MKEPTPPASIPQVFDVEGAKELVQQLEIVWEAQTGRPFGSVEADLLELKRFFDPLARGSRLRDLLDSLRLPKIEHMVPVSIFFKVDETSYLVTPEGRLLYERLNERMAAGDDPVVLTSRDIEAMALSLWTLYRNWAFQRLESVARLRIGEGAPMHLSSIGFVLFLLVNRSDSPRRAISRPRDASTRRSIDELISQPVMAFIRRLAPTSQSQEEHFSLYGGYALTEARRRLSRYLSDDESQLFVVSEYIPQLIDRLARELSRRDEVSETLVVEAFHSLSESYRRVRPELSSFGLAFGRPNTAAEVKSALVTSFGITRNP
jgi:hypothetical protein